MKNDEQKAFRLFEKLTHTTNRKHINNREPSRFNTPIKNISVIKFPNVTPNTSKNHYSNLNKSAPFDESKLVIPIIQFKLNNIPHAIFMKKYFSLNKGDSNQISLKKISILPSHKESNNRPKRRELNLSNANAQFIPTPKSKDFNTLKQRSTSRAPTKINTSALNMNENTIKWTISKYSYQSRSGETNGRSKTNQDSLLVLSQNSKEKQSNNNDKAANNQWHLFGVFDGHGEQGHNVSQTVKKAMESYFSNKSFCFNKDINSSHQSVSFLLTKNSYQVVSNAFAKASEMLKKQEFDSLLSGTTCILVLIVNDKIICANAGDSRAVLFNDKKSIVELSTDHKPQIKEEFERIIKSGGDVSKITPNDQGPYRVWIKNENYPGLAMSRSIGDFIAEKVGVISTPEIREKAINSGDCHFLVIGSDGLWEWLSVDEVKRIVLPYYKENNAEKAVRHLVDSARKKWVKMSNIVDDITVIVIFFGKK